MKAVKYTGIKNSGAREEKPGLGQRSWAGMLYEHDDELSEH